ncbi:DNA-processing protein DprA [Brackiella oedipodis]|uniref:DNA-processing protein DprA n=1 Tax=Brackiella oedipodis TaxID=124225 RepID=UPI003CCBED3E
MPSSMNSQELHSWLRLSLEPGVGPVRARQLLSTFGLPQQVFEAPLQALARHLPPAIAERLHAEIEPEIEAQIAKTLAWLEEPEHYLLTLADDLYPPSLLQSHDPPILLYADGQIESLKQASLAIVGTRNASLSGLANARNFAQYLASNGVCVVSGLAQGIDTAAHQGALASTVNKTCTIAVMGTGINRIYPSSNLQLARQIKAQGLLLSELPLDTGAAAHQFPRRNRIVAALALGTLVVQAAHKSGSLITAGMASELGREVFAIPDSIHSPLARGCHQLIKNGAKLVETAADIFEELHLPMPNPAAAVQPSQVLKSTTKRSSSKSPRPSKSLPTTSASRQALEVSPRALDLLQRMDFTVWSVDSLARELNWSIKDLNMYLLELELAERIQRFADGTWQQIPT